MQLPVVRAAYSRASAQYITLFDREWDAHEVDAAFIRRHLHQVPGPVLDLGCGPGYWTAYLHSLQVQTTGIDVVPEFIEYARAAHPGPQFRLGSMNEVDAPDECVAGILSWFSTIHTSPADMSAMLTEFRRLLAPAGMLVLGFFESEDELDACRHRPEAPVLAVPGEPPGDTRPSALRSPSADRPAHGQGIRGWLGLGQVALDQGHRRAELRGARRCRPLRTRCCGSRSGVGCVRGAGAV